MNPLDKIHALDEIEKEIILCMQSAGKRIEKPQSYLAKNR